MNLINKTNDLQFQQISFSVVAAPLQTQSQWSFAPYGREGGPIQLSVAQPEGFVALKNIEPDPQRSIFIKKKSSAKLRAKIVTFDNVLIIYYFKDYEDRKGYWIENRCHFERHCNRIQDIISFIFQDAHRDKIQKLIHKWAEDYSILVSGSSTPV